MALFLIACGAFLATLLGGAFALRYADRLHLVLGFTAGAMFGVAVFDLASEALRLGAAAYGSDFLLSVVAAGFLLYLLLDRTILPHRHGGHEHAPEHDASTHARGGFGAGTLSAHSFLDGVAIGVGFQVSIAVGAFVAIAVLAHDFSDGVNTAHLVLRAGGAARQAFRWLLVDALAPVAGIASTLFFRMPARVMPLALALFAGFFLYLSASDLIPESHHRHPRALTTLMTLLGALALYLVVHLAN